jgi:hypothetical protein
MGVPFDHIASKESLVSTDTSIACLHRQDYWRYVQQVIPQLENLEMLELSSCEFNTDSELLDTHGNNLLATDLTAEMANDSFLKKEQLVMSEHISSMYVNADSMDQTIFNKKFDLIFSGFGALNHLSPASLQEFFCKLPALIKPGGHFIAIVKPKFCALETISFMLKLQFTSAFRKRSGTGEAGSQHEMWYYNPSQIKNWSKEKFKFVSVNPIGLILPGSVSANLSIIRKRWLLSLHQIEQKLCTYQRFSAISDYFIIDLQRYQ